MMVFEFFEEGLRAIIKQVDAAVVQRGQYPGPVLVEGQALHALALRLKLRFHHLAATILFFYITMSVFCGNGAID